ncbi:MAG: TonB-dependent receptor [Bryobacteraceae bacterium]
MESLRAFRIAAAALLFGGQIWGQSLTGTLTGIVTDSSGAAVPQAQIILRNDASGDVRRTVTNDQGYFTIAAVFAGSYNVAIEATGFAKLERTGIVFNPGDKRHLSDLVLQVGATTETVTVTSAAASITTIDSGEKSAVINAQQLQNIAVVGRSAAELIKILPGMAPTGSGVENKPGFSGEVIGINGNGDGGRQSALGYYAANGTRTAAMDIVTDGAHTADPGCNCATPVNPNVDMLQEFKVLSSNYSAEHAKGPVVLNAITKSGGSSFHGMGYYYIRDHNLNSNDWQLNRAGQKRPANQFQFPGFNIGGPVIVPGTNFNKDRNKLFFFAGYEFFKQRLDTGVLSTIVPTEAMRAGDFTDTAYLSRLGSSEGNRTPSLPASGIVNGRVPANQIDPAGRILMNLLPPPNVDPAANGGNNYVNALLIDQPMHQFVTRVDYNVSDYTKLFVRYNLQRETQNFPVQLWGRENFAVPYPTATVGDNVSDSVSASYTKVFSPTMTNEAVFGYTFVDFPNRLDDPSKVSRANLGYPYQGIFKSGVDQIPNFRNNSGLATVFNRGGFNPIYPATKWLISFSDNFSVFRGRHSLKAGFFWETIIQQQPSGGESQGRVVYRTDHQLTTGNAYADLLTGRYSSYFEQNSNINVNQAFQTFEFYLQDSWKVRPNFTLELGARFAHLGPWYDREGIGFGVFDPARYSDDPAELPNLTGLVYQKIDSKIPTSGGTIAPLFFMPRVGFAWDLNSSGKTVLRGGFGAFRYHDPTCCGGTLNVPAGERNTTVATQGLIKDLDNVVPRSVRIGITTMDPNDDTQPINYNWSFSIARRLAGDMLLETAYVGNASRDLLNDGIRDINLVPYGAMFSNPTGNPDDFRPRRNYGAINQISRTFFQDYHSWQTTLQRTRGNLTYALAYTLSKTTGIRGGGQGSAADQFNPLNNHGILAYDRRHMFNISYVYELPRFVGNNPALGALVNGWQISGISQFASGVDTQSNTSVNFSLLGFLPNGQRINERWINGTNGLSAMPLLTCDPGKNLQPGQYVNGNCFAPPTPGNNGPAVMPAAYGPWLINHDISLFKNWALGESRKFQFRANFFNFPNHPLVTFRNGDPNLVLSFDQSGKLSNPRFGYTDVKTGRRVIQLGIKFYF